MRELVVRQPVAADHRQRMLHDALHVGLVHLEQDGAGRQQPLGGLLQPQVPLHRDVGEHAAFHLRVRHRPGDLHRYVRAHPIGHQHGGAGVVRVDVEIHLVLRRQPLDQRQRLHRAAEILRHRAFMVADHHRHAAGLADLHGFVDRIEHMGRLVAHMADIDAARVAKGLGHRDHLAGRRHHVGRVVEAGGEAARPFGEAFGQPLFHLRRLGIARRALGVAVHGFHPQRHVPDQRHRVHRRGVARQPVGVFAEAAEGPPAFIAQQVQRRHRPLLHPHRAQADAAIAHHHGGDALAHLAQHAFRPAQHGAVVMGVGVDEARGHRLAGGHHLAVRRHGAEVAHRHDTVARHRHVAARAGGAGAVEDGRVTQNQVAAQGHVPLLRMLVAAPSTAPSAASATL